MREGTFKICKTSQKRAIKRRKKGQLLPCLLLFVCLLYSAILSAQGIRLNKYWIAFKDKNGSPCQIDAPADFLSARALERRRLANIPITTADLPLSPAYIKAVENVGGVYHNGSKWLNAATFILDAETADFVCTMPFVQEVRYLGPHLKVRNPPDRPTKQRTLRTSYPQPGGKQFPWGYATRQNARLNTHVLHLLGARGAAKQIAVFDGGFNKADEMSFFDSVALQGRLLVGRDFTERDNAVFEDAFHGTTVLSLMASNLPGYFIGTAPDATYILFKTEEFNGEYPTEEANWVAAAEWADSAGIDIINSSLGYFIYSDTTLGLSKSALDGRTSIGARGAAAAAERGMIVCVSAGNEGNKAWEIISTPADAPGVIAVGATGVESGTADFSAYGPTADGRIKPDLLAPGDGVSVSKHKDIDLDLSSGTSLAAPMLAGSVAALWSAYPDKTAKEIMDAVFESADHFSQPDNHNGYGTPDMAAAWLRLGGYNTLQGEWPQHPYVYDAESGELSIPVWREALPESPVFFLYDLLGRRTEIRTPEWSDSVISTLKITGLEKLSAGFYWLGCEGWMGAFQLR